MNSLKELFDDTIKDLYNAEKQFVKAMPKLIAAAQSEQLRTTIQDHLMQSENHIQRLEKVAEICGIKPSGKVCKAAQGLVEEATEHLEEVEPGPTMDAGIVLCAQKNEHYEICSYGTLIDWAEELGLEEASDLLMQTLNEEKAADHLLTQAAKSANRAAAEGATVKQTAGSTRA